MYNVSQLTEAEKRELASAEAINSDGRAGRTVLLVLGIVLGSAVGSPVVGNTDLVATPVVGWPHVWVGCEEVAICQADETCERADWMKPGSTQALMARSAESPYEMLGVSECGQPPVTEQTGPSRWKLHVCGVVAPCYVVTSPNQYECLRGSSAPDGAAPPLAPSKQP